MTIRPTGDRRAFTRQKRGLALKTEASRLPAESPCPDVDVPISSDTMSVAIARRMPGRGCPKAPDAEVTRQFRLKAPCRTRE